MESGRCLRTQLHARDRSRVFRAFAANRVQASFSSVQRKCRDHRTRGLSPVGNAWTDGAFPNLLTKGNFVNVSSVPGFPSVPSFFAAFRNAGFAHVSKPTFIHCCCFARRIREMTSLQDARIKEFENEARKRGGNGLSIGRKAIAPIAVVLFADVQGVGGWPTPGAPFLAFFARSGAFRRDPPTLSQRSAEFSPPTKSSR